MAAEFAPEVLFRIGSFPVTNSLLNIFAVDAFLFGSVWYVNSHFKKVPGLFQNICEYVIDLFYNLTETVAGKHTKTVFPYFMSFFFFIVIANWSGLIPGSGAIGLKRDGVLVPIFRAGTSDLNITLALTLISFFITHYYAISTVGIKTYLGRYFSFNPIYLFVGILEIVSEFTKLISLSFRLFGNIFAGEMLLSTLGSLFAFLLPVPFLALEVIVGLVQALVFSMLTMVFMSVLMTPHGEEGH